MASWVLLLPRALSELFAQTSSALSSTFSSGIRPIRRLGRGPWLLLTQAVAALGLALQPSVVLPSHLSFQSTLSIPP